jgi:putative peptidoglycan lipid II flippase
MGVLISRNHFVTGAIAPVFFNLTLIVFGGILFFLPQWRPEQKVFVWAWGALAAGLVQLIVHIPPVWQEGFRWKPAWPFKEAGVKRVWNQMLPAIIGQSGNQINLWINSLMASSMAVGSASYLYYGTRMMQLPLGIFAVAISTAVLPSLSTLHGKKDSAEFKKTLGFGLRLTLFITLPATVGLILLSQPINVLLFKGGRFSLEDALNAAGACSFYSLGIVFASFNKVLGPAFYAREEAEIPEKVSAVGVVVNLAVSYGLKDQMGFLALALGTSLSNVAQAAMLVWLLRRRLGPLLRSEILLDFEKMMFCTAAMGLAVWGLGLALEHGLDPSQIYERKRLALEIFLGMGLACAVYFPLSKALGVDYLGPLLARRRKKV